MNVLVVDDDASVRESIRKVLEGVGYGVSLAADGTEALERFEAQPVDLVILDICLPIKNGWETFERITTQSPAVPVIIITGQYNQFDTALAAGVGALMEKPLDVTALLQTVETLLSEPKEARLRRLCGYSRDVRHLQPKKAKSAGKLWEPRQLRFRSSIWRNSTEH